MTQRIEARHTPVQIHSPSRRDFLVRAAVGGGLMVGFQLPGLNPVGQASAQTVGSSVTPWIVIGQDGTVTLQIASTEMGQGVMTGLAQIVADELRFDWSRIVVRHAPVDAAHGGRTPVRMGASPVAVWASGCSRRR